MHSRGNGEGTQQRIGRASLAPATARRSAQSQLAVADRLLGMLLLRVVPEADMRWLPGQVARFAQRSSRFSRSSKVSLP